MTSPVYRCACCGALFELPYYRDKPDDEDGIGTVCFKCHIFLRLAKAHLIRAGLSPCLTK